MKAPVTKISRSLALCWMYVQMACIFLRAMFNGINRQSDQHAENFSLCLDFNDEDGESALSSSLALAVLWLAALFALYWLLCFNISLLLRVSFSVTLPLFENVGKMPLREAWGNLCFAPLTLSCVGTLLFHFLRHAGYRLKH